MRTALAIPISIFVIVFVVDAAVIIAAINETYRRNKTGGRVILPSF